MPAAVITPTMLGYLRQLRGLVPQFRISRVTSMGDLKTAFFPEQRDSFSSPLIVRAARVTDHAFQPLTPASHRLTIRVREPFVPAKSPDDLVFVSDHKTTFWQPQMSAFSHIPRVHHESLPLPPALLHFETSLIYDGHLQFRFMRIPHTPAPLIYGFCFSSRYIPDFFGDTAPAVADFYDIALAVKFPAEFRQLRGIEPHLMTTYVVGPDEAMYHEMIYYCPSVEQN